MKREQTTHPLTLIPRSFWVIPGKFLAGPYPGGTDPVETKKKLTALIEAGIRHVLNLIEPNELEHYSGLFFPYMDQMAVLASEMKASVTFNQISIKDHAVPTRQEMVHILNQIDLCIKYDKPVYLHCLGGRGRTGTVVGCYLIRHGLATGKNVIDKIKELRRNVINWYSPSPETREQVEMLVNWETGL
jgi:hypothetical protein